MITHLLPARDETTRTGRGVRTRALLALARVETGRLLRHPLVWIGFLLSAAYAWVVLRAQLPVVPADITRLAATAGPLAIAVLLAANLGTLRPVRHDTGDVYGSVPVGPSLRTSAMLVASMASGLLGALFAAIGLVFMYATGGTGIPHVADVAAIPALVVASAVVGVAAARWVPKVAAGPIAAVVFAGVQLWFESGGGRLPRLPLTADWGASLYVPFDLVPRAPAVHLLYVAGVAVAAGAVAMLRHRASRSRLVAGVVGLVVVAAIVPVLLQPVGPEHADRLVAMAEDPALLNERNECALRGAVDHCAPPMYYGWVDHWHPTVTAALDALPADERPDRFRLTMYREVSPASLRPIVPDRAFQQLVELMRGWTDDRGPNADRTPRSQTGEVFVSSYQYHGQRGDGQMLDLAVSMVADTLGIGGLKPLPADVAARRRGLDEPPPGAGEQGIELGRCTPAGQAREIVALYVAAVNNPAAERALRHELDRRPYGLVIIPEDAGGGVLLEDMMLLDAGTFDANQAAEWSRSGATLTLQLLDRPVSDVLPRLHDGWVRWTAPDATRDDLANAFDLEPVPTVEELASEAGVAPSEIGNVPSSSAGQAPACT